MSVLGFAFVVGFLLSIPVGPVASLVIRQTLVRGFGAGIAAGAGVALADAIYGALGIVGATLPFAVALASGPARIAAGLVLIALGIALVRSRIPALAEREASLAARAAGFAGTFGIAILNPGATPIVAAAFAAAHIRGIGFSGYPAALAALFVGALVWWSLLALALVRFRERLGARSLLALNLATGAVAIVAGAATIGVTFAALRR